jgi:dihydroorotase
VARSNIALLDKLENRVRVIAPPTLLPPDIDRYGACEVFHDMAEGAGGRRRGDDAAFADRADGGRLRPLPCASSTTATASTTTSWPGAKPDAIVMHPGPMNRGVEIDALVADDPERSVIQEQVEMGVAVRMAVLDLLARPSSIAAAAPSPPASSISASPSASPAGGHRESFRSAGAAAAAGGVTTMVVRPDTDPPIDDPALLEFVRRRAAEAAPVRVHAFGALTKGLAGREMAELGLMADAGALGFTDADRPVADSRVFRRCLDYARGLDALVIHHPQEPTLTAGACATESEFSGRLGLPAAPAIAEAILLERDAALAGLTGARLHADAVTTAAGLTALERAKEDGVRVTAGTTIHHLALNELDVGDYRTFFKLDPPLRAETDRAMTAQAVADGPDRHDRLRPPPAGRGVETPALRGRGHRRRGAGDPAARGADARPCRPARPAGAVPRDQPQPGEADRAGAAASPAAPPRTSCCSTPTPRSFSTASRCARNRRTRRSTGSRMTGRVLRTWVGGETVYDRAAE